MLGHNVHGHLAQVQIGADTGGGGDSGFPEHLPDHLPDQAVGRPAPGFQIGRQIQQHLIYGIHMDVFRSHELEINLEHLGTFFHIPLHMGHGRNVCHFQAFVPVQPGSQVRTAGKRPAPERSPAEGVHLLHLPDHFEQTGPARDAPGLQGRGHRQADGPVRPAPVRHHQAGIQRIQSPFHTFHRGIERFQIDGPIDSLFHDSPRFRLF